MSTARLGLAAGLLVLLGLGASASAATKAAANPIQRENARGGSPDWRLPRASPGEIDGYATEVSVQPGDRLDLHVSTGQRYRVAVYRIGWYGGAGAREVVCAPGCSTDEQGAAQPVPSFDPSTGYLDAGWPVTD